MAAGRVMKLASRGKRLGAFCIDAALPVIAGSVLAASSAYRMIRAMTMSGGFGSGFGYPQFGYGYPGTRAYGVTALEVICWLIIAACAAAQLFFFSRSQTIGKAALGLRVVSSADGRPIGFWKMLLREMIVKNASGCIFMLGYIWILIDDKNRGWHDKILDTYVVDVKESEALSLESRAAARKQEAKTAAGSATAGGVSETDKVQTEAAEDIPAPAYREYEQE